VGFEPKRLIETRKLLILLTDVKEERDVTEVSVQFCTKICARLVV
jgi:hypothetical protein